MGCKFQIINTDRDSCFNINSLVFQALSLAGIPATPICRLLIPMSTFYCHFNVQPRETNADYCMKGILKLKRRETYLRNRVKARNTKVAQR